MESRPTRRQLHIGALVLMLVLSHADGTLPEDVPGMEWWEGVGAGARGNEFIAWRAFVECALADERLGCSTQARAEVRIRSGQQIRLQDA